MSQDKDIGNLILRGKHNLIQWKEFIAILIESKGLSHILEEKDFLDNDDPSVVSKRKEERAKALTIIRKYLDISLHYLIHGVRKPKEAFSIIEVHCIGDKDETILKLEDKLSNPEGRYFLEKLKSFNTSYRDIIMLGGKLVESKVIHKMFSIAPSNLAVALLQNEIQLYSKLSPERKITYSEVYSKLLTIAERQQEEYLKKTNLYRDRAAFLCFKCNKKGHIKANCSNPWYCTICKKEGHSSYRCKFNERNKQEQNKSNENESFDNEFVGMFNTEFSNYIVQEKIARENHLILDSGASYHCCGSQHLVLLKDVETLQEPRLVGAAGGKVYKSTKKGTFEGTLDNDIKIKLTDVYIFEELKVFLVSMAVLMSRGLILNAKLNTITILKNSNILYSVNKDKNNLFLIKYKEKQYMNQNN
eukprot:snap_masked-scaffold_76-processed-gene-0.56-mRNA-1 protein AED:1.00 eAED:1.00 QI:0/-1/0/0/-1/1/1/0/416